MNIFVYSDESGVFDKEHNDIFVFGGLILLGKDSKENWSRKYSAAEKVLRNKRHYSKDYELKATHLSNGDRLKLYRSLTSCYKFGVVINQKESLIEFSIAKKTNSDILILHIKLLSKKLLKI